MPGEQPPAAKSALPRTREPGAVDEEPRGLWSTLDRLRWLRPTLLFLPAVVAAVLLAPGLNLRPLPTDESNLGNPSSDNIKASHDLEVEDTEMTARLRDEAAAATRRVYDFDAAQARDTTQTIRRAFSEMEAVRAEFIESNPGWADPERLYRSERARLEGRLRLAFEAAEPRFIKALGTHINPELIQGVRQLHYSSQIREALVATLDAALTEPIIERRATLERDGDNGITVQRVPDDGSSAETITNLERVLTLEEVQRSLSDRVRELAPQLPAEQHGLVADIAAPLLRHNLTLNQAATHLAREDSRLSVKPAKIIVKKGEMIIRDGERFSRRHLLIFAEMERTSDSSAIVQVGLGAALLVLLLTIAGFAFVLRRSRRRDELNARDAVFLTALFVAGVVAGRVWLSIAMTLAGEYANVPLLTLLFVTPVALGAMMARLVLRIELALAFGVVASVVLGLMAQTEPLFTVYALISSVLGAVVLGTINARGDLLRSGVWVGVGHAATALGILLFEGYGDWTVYVIALPVAFLGGVAAGFFALALTPIAESIFGYTTDLKLLELANLNHPALKELIVQAPGSYHHSIIVGSLVEAAADAIGANPLLSKVMAYYHDLGKGCNAAYFIENQRGGHNPHDKLKPSMSAMVIRRHVTDGLEIAKRYGLGEQILAGIAEHHGTTLIQYFYARAQENVDEDQEVSETDYRYPGRKPQSRETALVMLADSVEAASRSLNDHSPARLKGLVNKIINMKFTDGQLDECDLTLKNLHLIARAFIDVLTPIYHQRVEYPELAKKNDADSDSKPPAVSNGSNDAPEEDRPDNIRRLGLS